MTTKRDWKFPLTLVMLPASAVQSQGSSLSKSCLDSSLLHGHLLYHCDDIAGILLFNVARHFSNRARVGQPGDFCKCSERVRRIPSSSESRGDKNDLLTLGLVPTRLVPLLLAFQASSPYSVRPNGSDPVRTDLAVGCPWTSHLVGPAVDIYPFRRNRHITSSKAMVRLRYRDLWTSIARKGHRWIWVTRMEWRWENGKASIHRRARTQATRGLSWMTSTSSRARTAIRALSAACANSFWARLRNPKTTSRPICAQQQKSSIPPGISLS